MWSAASNAPARNGSAVKIGHRVQPAVVPGGVAHRQIHAAVSLAGEVVRVLALARAGVEHARAGGQRGREGRHGILDLRFEVQNVAPQRASAGGTPGRSTS